MLVFNGVFCDKPFGPETIIWMVYAPVGVLEFVLPDEDPLLHDVNVAQRTQSNSGRMAAGRHRSTSTSHGCNKRHCATVVTAIPADITARFVVVDAAKAGRPAKKMAQIRPRKLRARLFPDTTTISGGPLYFSDWEKCFHKLDHFVYQTAVVKATCIREGIMLPNAGTQA